MKDFDYRHTILTEKDFDEWPVWSFTDDHEAYRRVRNFDELPYLMDDLLIKALFFTSQGVCFKGYVVGIVDISAIGFFSGGEEFIFNAYAYSRAYQAFQGLLKTIPLGIFKDIYDMFPLKYETQIDLPGWKNIRGEFKLFNGESLGRFFYEVKK